MYACSYVALAGRFEKLQFIHRILPVQARPSHLALCNLHILHPAPSQIRKCGPKRPNLGSRSNPPDWRLTVALV